MGMITEGIPPAASSNTLNLDPMSLLSRVIAPAQLKPWLKQPNPAFDGSTPQQAIKRGEVDRIRRMLYDLESGQPS